MAKTFDAKCYDLAEYFLEDGPDRFQTAELHRDLACTIQQAIEDWLSEHCSSDEYPDPRTNEDWKRHAE